MAGKQRIGDLTAGLLLVSAALVDLVQFLLDLTVLASIAASLITIVSGFTFWLWFMMLGVKYTGPGAGRKVLLAFASIAVEFVPVVNALPATFAGVLGIIVATRAEDARANAGKKVTPRTAMATARTLRMRASRERRADQARQQRDAAQQARHPAAPAADNDNEPAG